MLARTQPALCASGAILSRTAISQPMPIRLAAEQQEQVAVLQWHATLLQHVTLYVHAASLQHVALQPWLPLQLVWSQLPKMEAPGSRTLAEP